MTGNPDAIIVGAGPAGLACAMTMRAAGLNVTVLEKADAVGSVWRRHYDRLHLHTDRNHSGLPGMAMPPIYPTYPSREQVVEYLESYTARFNIKPVFNATVRSIRRDGTQWRADAAPDLISAPVVVVATGIADAPYRPSWPGSELHRGRVIHSSEYRNPTPYVGKRVLVVGFGNSGGEIALDLANAKLDVGLAVRGPVQILPRDLLGFPILAWAILYRRLPARLVDLINAPILRLALGSIEELGLRRASKGPRQMVEEDGRVPLIDIGTLDKIRDGSIKIYGGIDRLTSRRCRIRRGQKRKIRCDYSCDRLPPRPAPIIARCGRYIRQAWHAAFDRPGDKRAWAIFLRSDHFADGTIARDWTGSAVHCRQCERLHRGSSRLLRQIDLAEH